MKGLALYPEVQIAPVDNEEPRLLNHECALCPLEANAKNVCIPAEGSPGGLLVVGDFPTQREDAIGRPYLGTLGARLRKMIQTHWSGPVVLDYALRCRVKQKVSQKWIESCRGYLAQTIKDVRPKRVIVMGPHAMKSVLGRSQPALSIRKSVGWIDKENVPVFPLMSSSRALRNRFLTSWFEEDLKWALQTDIEDLKVISSRDGCAMLIENLKDAERAVRILRRAEWISYDCETVGFQHNGDFEIVSIAVSAKGSEDAFVWSEESLHDASHVPLLELLKDRKVKKVAQNAKFDAGAIYCFYTERNRTLRASDPDKYEARVRGLTLDTRLVRKILEPESSARLETLQELVGMGGGKEIADAAITSAIKRSRKEIADVSELSDIGPLSWVMKVREAEVRPQVYAYGLMPPEIRDQYCARDAVSTARIAERLEKELDAKPPIKRLWKQVILNAARAIEYIEGWGILVSQKNVRKFKRVVETKHDEVFARIQKTYKSSGPKDGEAFNPNSTKHVQEYLYNRFKLPVIKRTAKGAAATDKQTLVLLQTAAKTEAQRNAVEDLLQFRVLSKLRSTYANGFSEFVRGDGRVHPSFHLDGARSGRMSCSDPNMQQIPRPTSEFGGMARNCFVSPKGYKLVQFDYSQLELRVAAMLSGDQNMKAIFQSGADYHQRTAELISKVAWGIDPSQVTKEHRSKAKGVNFGLLYGMSPKSLGKRIGCTTDEANKIQTAVFGSLPDLKRWCADRLREARRTGETWTYWDGEQARCRPMFQIADHDDEIRSRAENGSWNTPVQGTASDFCLASLARCVGWIISKRLRTKLVLTVHDSLLFEVPPKEYALVLRKVPELMCSWETSGVPLVVDCEVGTAWGEMIPHKLSVESSKAQAV